MQFFQQTFRKLDLFLSPDVGRKVYYSVELVRKSPSRALETEKVLSRVNRTISAEMSRTFSSLTPED
jgi:hypothetical protein